MDKPIIFSAPMVRAILAGVKTQTRRVIKFEREYLNYGTSKYQWIGDDGYWHPATPSGKTGLHKPVKMKYQKGDLLWVKENYFVDHDWHSSHGPFENGPYLYQADAGEDGYSVTYLSTGVGGWGAGVMDYRVPKWLTSRFMPRKASRILLEVERVGVAYLQEITNEDAVKEGVIDDAWLEWRDDVRNYAPPGSTVQDERGKYQQEWDKLNAKRGYAWDSNPLVWVIDFKRIKPAEDVTY